jgi:DNA polymerase epsilon subunit 3
MSSPSTASPTAAAAEAAATSPAEGTKDSAANTNAGTSNTTKQPNAIEFEPPLACVRRILKNSLPSSTNVGKDASAAFARACGIFIIYLTACANDFARENKRQTITANDVLAALTELDFQEFTPQLTTFLEAYRATERTKKETKAAVAKNKGTTAGKSKAATAAGDDEDDDEEEEHDDGTPAAHTTSPTIAAAAAAAVANHEGTVVENDIYPSSRRCNISFQTRHG